MSMMPVHDHSKRPEGGVYCPLMKEKCYSGWTPSMGESNDERKLKPTCVRWVGVFLKRGIEAPIEEVFDCADRWGTDMMQQIAQEIYQGAVATEEVLNRVTESNGVNRTALAFFQGIAKRMRAEVMLPQPAKPERLPAPTDNGKVQP